MAPQNHHLRFHGPKVTKFLWNFGLWQPELCSEVLNPETVLVTNLAQFHYLLICITGTDVF